MKIKHSNNHLNCNSDFKCSLYSSRRISLDENKRGIFLKFSDAKKLINPRQVNIEYKINYGIKKSRNNFRKKYLRDSSFLQINYFKLFRKMKLRNQVDQMGIINKINLNYNPLVNYLNVGKNNEESKNDKSLISLPLTNRNWRKNSSNFSKSYFFSRPSNRFNLKKHYNQRDLLRNNSNIGYNQKSTLYQKKLENCAKMKSSERKYEINNKYINEENLKLIQPFSYRKNIQKYKILKKQVINKSHSPSKTNNITKEELSKENNTIKNDLSPW